MNELEKSLKFMDLTPFVTFKEIKQKYLELSKKFHPDCGGSSEEMDKLNQAYKLLKDYVDSYRFTFSEDEIDKQYIGNDYARRYRF